MADSWFRSGGTRWHALSRPDRAETVVEAADVKRFPDGGWVVGVGIDSHSWKQARDSRGEVRVFVGYVCGPHWLAYNLSHVKSLDEFYERPLRMNHFAEHRVAD